MKKVVLIPSRLQSERLPEKPLKLIGDKTMIRRVYEAAKKSEADDVVVATDAEKIFEEVKNFGGTALMTKSDHTNGTERIFEASEILDLKDEDYVVNLQGDEPFTDPIDLNKIFSALESNECQTVSLFTDFKKESDLDDLSKVKVELNGSKAKLFYRAINDGSDNPYLHLGVYGFRYEALRRFVALPKTENEVSLKLEQLRALDNNMQIHMVRSEAKIHLGIDTVKDLEQANKLIVNDIE